MLKKFFLCFIIVASVLTSVYAQEIEVTIRPVQKITTSNSKIGVGDDINFIVDEDVCNNSKLVIKKGTPVVGVITNIEDNDFLYQPASLYAENFKSKDVNGRAVKLKGIVYKKGNDHSMITQFIPVGLVDLRGGEVQIKPKKDKFTLFVENWLKD